MAAKWESPLSDPAANAIILLDIVYAYAHILIQLRMAAKFARAGKLTAKFYTDGWPEFTAVVCHILSPALCNVSPTTDRVRPVLYSKGPRENLCITLLESISH